MTRAAPSRHAFQPLLRALKSGLPRLVLETGQEPLVLCFRREGELIHDTACAQHFKAAEEGVYRCCEILQGGARGSRWTFYCPLNRLLAQLKCDLAPFTRTQWSNLLLHAAWQIECHCSIALRNAPVCMPRALTPTAMRRRRKRRLFNPRALNAPFLPRLPSSTP